MRGSVTPMIHVPDVKATALWYQSIGFAVQGWHEEDAEAMGRGPLSEAHGAALDWAYLTLGDSALMLNEGGQASDANRREVDLYVDVQGEPDVDALYAQLGDRVEVVEAPYDAFHGNRELIIRDPNGFWITFAQPVKR